ncbi:hypothetical protein FACS189419_09070 [Planctomycetales bacterium]|nr:hypothetical protein FACS189419_09070 [Planctomycetales bacterium]
MQTISRRQFIGTAAVAVTAAASFPRINAESTAPLNGKIYKARGIGFPDDKTCEQIKNAGYAGVELDKWNVSPENAVKARQTAQKHGLQIHSVLLGWTEIDNPAAYEQSIEKVKMALKTAALYGADTVLWVPCKIGGFPNSKIGKPDKGTSMPAAWEFDIDFAPETLLVKSVAENGDYPEYIQLQNTATLATLKAVEQLLPVAAYEGVRIGIENVWNNLWTTPKFYAALCNHFKNPWVGSYFDLGNHAMYADPVEWLKAIGGNNLFKLHIKGFNVTEVKGKLGGGPGNWSKIDEASINWKAVRQTLSGIGFSGWLTTEDDGRSMEEYSPLLDNIIQ